MYAHKQPCIYMHIYTICTHIQGYTHTCICTAIDTYEYVHAHPQQICMSISAYVYSSTNDAQEDKSLSAYRWLSTKLLQLPPLSHTKPSIRTGNHLNVFLLIALHELNQFFSVIQGCKFWVSRGYFLIQYPPFIGVNTALCYEVYFVVLYTA